MHTEWYFCNCNFYFPLLSLSIFFLIFGGGRGGGGGLVGGGWGKGS